MAGNGMAKKHLLRNALIALFALGVFFGQSGKQPQKDISAAATVRPTAIVTKAPTHAPTTVVTAVPTAIPTIIPTALPTAAVTAVPTAIPTTIATALPADEQLSYVPNAVPTAQQSSSDGVIAALGLVQAASQIMEEPAAPEVMLAMPVETAVATVDSPTATSVPKTTPAMMARYQPKAKASAASTTAAPRSTATVRATATPRPSATAKPRPTATPKPKATATPKPRATATPRATNRTPAKTYILNTNTKKFHYPSCSSVKQMKDKNKRTYTGDRQEVIRMGYVPCKRCNP